MQFDIDCAIDIMNYIIDNQKLDLDSGKLTIFYFKIQQLVIYCFVDFV